MFLKIPQGLALGHVIRILLEVTEPELAILPVNITQTFHSLTLQPRRNARNGIMLAERAN